MQVTNLKNQELESQLFQLVKQERKLLHVILLHIREVDKRKLYLERSRSSLFEYLVKDLNYSAAAAQRRVEASRLLKDLPELSEKIQSGSVNLSQIGELSRAIKQKERECSMSIPQAAKSELLLKIENKSTHEAQSILAKELDIQLKPLEVKRVQKDESIHLQITFTKEQYQKLEECKNLASHVLLQKGDLSISSILDVLMDAYLANKKLAPKQTNPQKLTSKQLTPKQVHLNNSKQSNLQQLAHTPKQLNSTSLISKPLTPNLTSKPMNPKQCNAKQLWLITDAETQRVENASLPAPMHRIYKSITPKLRKTILSKFPCCQYLDLQTQNICGSRFALQIEHIQPRWAQGPHQTENLTVLCASHNKYKYEKQMQIIRL